MCCSLAPPLGQPVSLRLSPSVLSNAAKDPLGECNHCSPCWSPVRGVHTCALEPPSLLICLQACSFVPFLPPSAASGILWGLAECWGAQPPRSCNCPTVPPGAPGVLPPICAPSLYKMVLPVTAPASEVVGAAHQRLAHHGAVVEIRGRVGAQAGKGRPLLSEPPLLCSSPAAHTASLRAPPGGAGGGGRDFGHSTPLLDGGPGTL